MAAKHHTGGSISNRQSRSSAQAHGISPCHGKHEVRLDEHAERRRYHHGRTGCRHPATSSSGLPDESRQKEHKRDVIALAEVDGRHDEESGEYTDGDCGARRKPFLDQRLQRPKIATAAAVIRMDIQTMKAE